MRAIIDHASKEYRDEDWVHDDTQGGDRHEGLVEVAVAINGIVLSEKYPRRSQVSALEIANRSAIQY
jgi:hypothetical protein